MKQEHTNIEKAGNNSKIHDDAKILSRIGQKIISCYSVDEIISTVYQEVNTVMDATSMNLGIYNKETNRLEFPGTMERGVKLDFHWAELDETYKLPIVCYKEEQEILINDLQVEAKKYTGHDPVSLSDDGEIVEALIYTPLYSKGKLLGVISVQSFEKNSYTEYHLSLLKNIGNYVGIAIENAQLYQKMEEKVNERTFEVVQQKEQLEKTFEDVKLLNVIAQKITACLSIEEIIEEAYDQINTLMDASVFGIGIYNPENDSIHFSSPMEDGKKLPSFSTELSSEKPASWCFNRNEEIIILDLKTDLEKYSKESLGKAKEGKSQESIVYFPLNLKDRTIGVITIQSPNKKAYKPHQLEMLRNISVFSAIALDNAKIYSNVEKEVELRSKEIEDAYNNTKLLSEIGKDIIACLSIDKISETVYDNLNKLMIADTFGVAIHNQENNSLDFLNLVEHGKAVPFHQDKLDDMNMVSSYCFNNNKDLLINDYKKEHTQYIPKRETWVKVGLVTHSIIYVPLETKNKLVGVLTVQSTQKNAYTKYHLDIVKNIATYTSIAIENAQIYENLEGEVKDRTKEVVQQKNKIEKTYKNFTTISEVGKDIISSLSVEEIIEKAYGNVNSLMDAAAFGIGIYNGALKSLEFSGAIENGKKLPYSSDDLTKNSYASICFLNSEKVVINSTSEYQKAHKKARVGEIPESLIYLPLISNRGTIGVITVQSFTENAYSNYHIGILETLANYTAIALENAKSYESIAALSEIGKEISSSLDLNAVLSYLYKKVNKMMDASIFLASSYSNKTKVLTYELCMEKGEQILQGHKSTLKYERDSIASWVVHNKKEVIINDLYAEYKTYIDTPIAPAGDIPESLIYIPLIVEDNVIGIVSIQSLKKNAYNKHNIELIRSLASYVSGAFNNAIAYKEIEAARKEMEKLSIVASETDNAVIIMDKDGNFEWVNKAYEEMSGFDVKGLIKNVGKSIKDIDDSKLQKNLSKVYSTKKSVSFESSFITKFGSKIWVQTNISPVLNDEGEIIKLVALDSNITERKKSELKIREKNKDITDSINYASRIQRAMLPKPEFIDHLLPDSFILYKPRDIVSGDFYWMTKTANDEILVATVDCTGHGVPGAFLTIVGNNLLNQIVNSNGITEPGEVLTHMNILMLKQFEGTTQGGMKDGMDMSLCKLTYLEDKVKICYAGAYNSLFHISDGNLNEIKANRFSIGTPLDRNPTYQTHEIECHKGDIIYMCSDGFQDQIGGERGKKFKKIKFMELISTNYHLPISKQKEFYNDIIENWRGEYPQLDDILMMGIQF